MYEIKETDMHTYVKLNKIIGKIFERTNMSFLGLFELSSRNFIIKHEEVSRWNKHQTFFRRNEPGNMNV